MINDIEIKVALDSDNTTNENNKFKLSPIYSRVLSFTNNHNLRSNNFAGAGFTFLKELDIKVWSSYIY